MAKKYSIRSATDRASLAHRREPYWSPISKGLAVGYRVVQSYDSGIWQARWRDPATGKHRTVSLGQFADIPSADGKRIESPAYDQAQRAAMAWAADMRAGVQNKRSAVRDACEHYVRIGLASRPKAQDSARGAFKKAVEGNRLAAIPLADLRRQHLRDWMQDCVEATFSRTKADPADPEALRRARETANRDFRTLRAALNMAHADGLCGDGSAKAWSTGVAFQGTGKGRDNYLTEQQTDAWIDQTPEPLASFLRGLVLTASRPGELAKARVQDFDAKAGTLTLATGKRKEGYTPKLRTVSLSDAAVSFLSDATKSKIGKAHLFADSQGREWTRQTWQPCSDSAQIAGLPPGTSAYDLRHAAISRWLAGGLSTFEAAKLAGTSVQMIDKHYGHLLQGVTAERLNKAAADTAGH